MPVSPILGKPLKVLCGSVPGRTMKVRGAFLEVEERTAGVLQGRVSNWTRLAVLAAAGDKARLFILEPTEAADFLVFEPFIIEGDFRVVSKQNNARLARAGFREFSKSNESA